MDIHIPAGAQKAYYPVVLTVHGGEWYGGNKSQLNRYTNTVLASGCIHVNINYRLLNNGIELNADMPYAEMLNDIEMAFDFLSSNAEKYQINTTKACIAGYSSGGHLALLYAYTRKDASIPIELVISEAGPANFMDPKTFTEDGKAWIHESHNGHETIELIPSMTKQKRIDLIGDITGTRYEEPEWEEAWKKASPAYVANDTSPKTILFYSAHDSVIPISHAELLKSKLSNCILYEILYASNDLYSDTAVLNDFNNKLNTILKEFKGM
jgi:acetyl esterase/lipase